MPPPAPAPLVRPDPATAPQSGEPGPARPSHELEAENARLREQVRALRAAAAHGEEDVARRLSLFADTSNGWFWEMDSELRFSYFSPSVETVTGVPPEWHYGKTREDIGMPESVSPEAWRAHLETLARHEPFTDFVFARKGPDGIRWMCTSGVPHFDHDGRFAGYCGTASDITGEVEARDAAARLLAAVENLDELFVLWSADDRLVMCNARFREINAAVAHTTRPGTLFRDHIEAAMEAGLYPQATGREQEWLEERLERHRHPGGPVEMERQDGRWLLLREHRLADGSTATISTDITERKRMEGELAESHQVLEAALETVPDGIMVLDDDLQLVASNARLWEITGLDQERVTSAQDPGRTLRLGLASRGAYGPHDGDLERLVASREAIARSRQPVHYECQLSGGNWLECRGRPIRSGGYLAVYRDVNESKRLQVELERLASHDELTGVRNRRSFLDALGHELERMHRYNHPLSVLLIDVDRFKAVNDDHGHAAGDEMLRVVSATMAAVLREVDILGRLGGEEFAALLPASDRGQAMVAAERLRRAVAAARATTAGSPLSVTVSVGVVQASQALSAADLLARADDALYEAKHGGRNRVVCA